MSEEVRAQRAEPVIQAEFDTESVALRNEERRTTLREEVMAMREDIAKLQESFTELLTQFGQIGELVNNSPLGKMLGAMYTGD